MSDTLIVSGGGRITVAPEDILVAATRCRNEVRTSSRENADGALRGLYTEV